MAIDPRLQHYLNHLNNVIHSLQNRLETTEARVRQLESDLESMKSDPKMNVGRIEYKFDQLKIERLDGTLNIGLTPKSEGELLDELTVGNTPLNRGNQPNNPPSPMMQDVLQRTDAFLQNEAMDSLIQIENKHAFPLNDPYRLFIIEDVRKQIPNQVTQIMNQFERQPEQKKRLEEEPDQVVDDIYEMVKQDVVNGLERFIVNLRNGSEPE